MPGSGVPRIERVEWVALAIPYPKPRRFGRHVLTAGENVIVRIQDDAGHIGYGEAVSRPYIYGESSASIVHAISEWFAPAMIGASIFDAERIWQSFDRVAMNHAAKSGLDHALHDLQAQMVGEPLWRWLGGDTPTIALSWILTYGSPDAVAAEALTWADRGFRSFKIKVSADREQDRRVLARLRQELPAGIRLYADANGTFSRSDLIVRAHELVDFGIELLEDPLPTRDIRTRREIWPSCPLPILADETATSVTEAATEVDSGAVDVFSLKIFRTGIRRSTEIATVARAFGRQCLVGGQGETHVGAAIAAHFASGLRGMGFDRYLAETSSAYRYDFDLTLEGPRLVDGALHLSDVPGSGIVLNEDQIERLAMPMPGSSIRRVGPWFTT